MSVEQGIELQPRSEVSPEIQDQVVGALGAYKTWVTARDGLMRLSSSQLREAFLAVSDIEAQRQTELAAAYAAREADQNVEFVDIGRRGQATLEVSRVVGESFMPTMEQEDKSNGLNYREANQHAGLEWIRLLEDANITNRGG